MDESKGNDQNVQDWRDALPQDLQAHEALKEFKDIGEFAKSYLDVSKKAGEALVMPAEDAKPEDVAAFFAKLGKPEKADLYDLKKPELPDGLKWDEALDAELADMRQIAFDLDLNNRQAQRLLDVSIKEVARLRQEAAKAQETAITKLKEDLGKDHEAKITSARDTMLKLGGKELVDYVGGDPVMLKFFAKIAPRFSEEEVVAGEPAGKRTIHDVGAGAAAVLYPNMK